MSTRTEYVGAGTLTKPGPIGRIVRLVGGLAAMFALSQVILYKDSLLENRIPAGWVILIAIALAVFPYVVNLGWGRSWGRWPQIVIVVAVVLIAAVNFVVTGEAWGPTPGAVLGIWMAYTFGHLGMSFLIAAAIATPGCEMRALPHLWTLLTGRATAEHHCPGPLDRVDRWEAGSGRN